MGNSNAIKAICAMGAITLVFLLVTSFGLKRAMKPTSKQQVVIRQKYSHFDARRAWDDLEHIVGLGPRVAGSEEAAAMRVYLRAQLDEAGLAYREDAWEADTPIGPVEMVNLTAVIPGTLEDVIILGNHYDTKYLPSIEFVGANDGGSTTAWMLEMARTLGPEWEGHTLWLVWFDGEEAFGEWSDTDGVYGSRKYVEDLQASGRLDQVKLMINVDMIGDCYLGILQDRDASEWLNKLVWSTAAKLGYGDHFSAFSHQVYDDHMPFRLAGVEALELIDFVYGGSPIIHQQTWHTDEDTLDKVCPESLQAVADVIYHALPAIEEALGDGLPEVEGAP